MEQDKINPLKGQQSAGNYKATGSGAFANGRACTSIEAWNTDGTLTLTAYVLDEFDAPEGAANAALYAEAHNVANETGLWPREMAEEIGKLRDLLNVAKNNSSLNAYRLHQLGDDDSAQEASAFADELARALLSPGSKTENTNPTEGQL